MPIRTVLFIDYQNAYGGAREAFHSPDDPSNRGGFDPIRLGHLLLKRSTNRKLTEVRVYRGRPSRGRDPLGHNVNRRQAAAWESRGATVITRILRYPDGWPAQPPMEKGIDVALAVDFVVMALLGHYDVGILLSTDSDLEPALEAVCELSVLRAVSALRSSSVVKPQPAELPATLDHRPAALVPLAGA